MLKLFRSLRSTPALAVPAAALVVPPGSGGDSAAAEPDGDLFALESDARRVLRQVMEEDKSWPRIHAEEMLVIHGEADRVRAFILAEIEHGRSGASPEPSYRVGNWRVLATIASTGERSAWVDRIVAVFLDETAPDRGAALESLCKLEYRFAGETLKVARAMEDAFTAPEKVVPRWALYMAGDASALPALEAGLTSSDPVVRRRSSYVLRWIHAREPKVLQSLARAAAREPGGSDTHAFMVSAALSLGADSTASDSYHRQLVTVLESGTTSARYEASQTMARLGFSAPRTLLAKLLQDADPDVRVAAAHVIIAQSRRP